MVDKFLTHVWLRAASEAFDTVQALCGFLTLFLQAILLSRTLLESGFANIRFIRSSGFVPVGCLASAPPARRK